MTSENVVNFAYEAVSVDPLKEPLSNSSGTACNLKCKNNKLNNSTLRLKGDERIRRLDEDDFVLSQSDCYIAKQREKSMEELSKEYKMSQSDCHISKLRKTLSGKSDVKDAADLSCNVQTNVTIKDTPKRKHCKDLPKHHNNDFQPDISLNDIENNQSFNMGSFVSNSSCGILTLSQNVNKDLIKYTGSLESPLRDIENTSGIEKGAESSISIKFINFLLY